VLLTLDIFDYRFRKQTTNRGQALTGRLALWQVPVAIAIAAIFLTLANLAWRAGLRRYSSASS
jgi:ABC-type uncharacterized transport system permease subunit